MSKMDPLSIAGVAFEATLDTVADLDEPVYRHIDADDWLLVLNPRPSDPHTDWPERMLVTLLKRDIIGEFVFARELVLHDDVQKWEYADGRI